MNRIYYPYSEFRDDMRLLVNKIDQEFDTIVPIGRGGLSMGHMLGEYWDIRQVYSINTIGYNDIQKLKTVKVFNLPNLKESKRVLIVDDIVDSGDTLVEVMKMLNVRYPKITFYTATIFYKKNAKITPTWYVKVPQGWIDFFWTEDLKICS